MFVHAQIPLDETNYRDSLLAQTNIGTDEQKASAHYKLCGFYSVKSDSLKMANHLGMAKKLAGTNSFLNDIYDYYKIKLIEDTHPDKAIAQYKKTDSLLQKYKLPEGYLLRSLAWSSIARLKQLADDENGAIELLTTKAMPLANQSENLACIGKVYLGIGIGLYNTLQFQKSNEYSLKAAESVKNLRPAYAVLPDAFMLMAKNHIMLERYDSAGIWLSQAFEVLRNYPESELLTDYYEINGMYLYKVKDFENSIQSLDKGIQYAQKYNNRYQAQAIYNRKFNFYFEQRQYQNALSVLNETNAQLAIHWSTRNRMGQTYNYARVHGKLGNYQKAYDSLSRFVAMKDSLEAEGYYHKTQQLEAKFNLSEKERKILELQIEKDKETLQSQRHRSNNRMLWVVSVLLFALAFVSWIYYKRIGRQKEINHQQELKDLVQQQEIQLTKAMLDGEERERLRVARDLHDGLGGMLAGVKLNLSDMEDSHQELQQDNALNRVIGQLDNSISELRRIARNMMPDTLLKLGLEMALKDLCAANNTPTLEVRFQALGIATDIPLSNQSNIYRIVQEVISNAVKHAKASRIMVQCSQNEELFLITIEDNGIGFDMAALAGKKGLGWNNIKNRVAFLKGKLDVQSQHGEGTTVDIELNCYAG